MVTGAMNNRRFVPDAPKHHWFNQMAIVYDLDGLLKQFTKSREQQPYYVAKDVAVETVFGNSPINFGSFLRYELEVDLEEFIYHERDSNNTKSAIDPKKKAVVHTFELDKDKNKYKFTKDNVAPLKQPPSEITALAKQGAFARANPANTSGPKLMHIQVFFPTRESVKIQVAEKTIVEEVIKLVMQQYEMECNANKKQLRFNMNPRAYVLSFAESDGTLDDDMPALGREQEIGIFKKNKYFLLTPDTSFKVVGSTTNKTGNVPLCVKVLLPNEEGFVSVAYNRDMTLGMILEIVARKTNLLPEETYFDTQPPKGTPLSMDQTLGALGVTQLRVFEKNPQPKNKMGHKRQPSVGSNNKSLRNLRKANSFRGEPDADKGKRSSTTFGSPNNYQEFQVAKIKQFGLKQDRIIGIDNVRIINKLPDNSGNKQGSTKRPERFINEVSKAYVTNRPNLFCIEFTDGRTYRYESNQSDEIVLKINQILKLKEAS